MYGFRRRRIPMLAIRRRSRQQAIVDFSSISTSSMCGGSWISQPVLAIRRRNRQTAIVDFSSISSATSSIWQTIKITTAVIFYMPALSRMVLLLFLISQWKAGHAVTRGGMICLMRYSWDVGFGRRAFRSVKYWHRTLYFQTCSQHSKAQQCAHHTHRTRPSREKNAKETAVKETQTDGDQTEDTVIMCHKREIQYSL